MSINLKQGLLLKSSDGEYVYNIYSYTPGVDAMIVDILTPQLETITSRQWSALDFKKQIEAGQVVEFAEDEMIGVVE